MSRRAGSEKTTVLTINATSGASPLTALSVDADKVFSPKIIVIANASGLTATVTITGLGTFVVATADTFEYELSDVELAIGADYIISTDQTVDVTTYYTLYDESAGITKDAARFASLNPPLATRTPNFLKGRSKS